MNKYQKLEVWHKSIDLTVKVYSLSDSFPSKEKFGLCSQITRSAVSIPSNIAEGAGRNNKGEFNQFLGIALGSLFELETQLIIASKLHYFPIEELVGLEESISAIRNMIYGLQKSLTQKS